MNKFTLDEIIEQVKGEPLDSPAHALLEYLLEYRKLCLEAVSLLVDLKPEQV